MSQKTVKAKKVREGDFLPGLHNGYVHSNPDVDEYNVRIDFHDAEGGDGHIECFKDMPITIERRT